MKSMVSRADVAESRAGVAESRADAAEARAGTAEARADAAEKRADISATEKKALEGKLMQTVDANLKVRSKRRGQQRPFIQRNFKRTRVSDIIRSCTLVRAALIVSNTFHTRVM